MPNVITSESVEQWQRLEQWVTVDDPDALKTMLAMCLVEICDASSVAIYQPDYTARNLVPIAGVQSGEMLSLPSISLQHADGFQLSLTTLNLQSRPFIEQTGTAGIGHAAALKSMFFGDERGRLVALQIEHMQPVNRLYVFLNVSSDVSLSDVNATTDPKIHLIEAIGRTYQSLALSLQRSKTENLAHLSRETAIRAQGEQREKQQKSAGLAQVLVGASDQMQSVREKIMKYAPCDFSVLVIGEMGTGKSEVARQLHRLSSRQSTKLLFQSAALAKADFFLDETRLPDGCTLVLSNVHELEAHSQIALLERLQEPGRLNKQTKKGVRLICTTSQDVGTLMNNGTLREELFHRVCQLTLKIPPLRSRAVDMRATVEQLASEIAATNQLEKLEFNDDAVQFLCGLELKGNSRELKNILNELALDNSELAEIGVEDLRALLGTDQSFVSKKQPGTKGHEYDFKTVIKSYEKKLLSNAYSNCEGDRSKMAKQLNLPLRTLSHKLNQQGICGKKGDTQPDTKEGALR